MYSSVWKLLLRNRTYYIPLESSQHQEAENHHISLRCVKLRDATDHNKSWHSSPCLSYDFCTNEDKSKILSSWCLVLLSLVILDTINCHKGSFHQCCNAHNFCAFLKKNCRLFKNLSCSINSSFACLKPQSHICYKFSLSLRHSMNYYKDHTETCMKPKFIVFLMKKTTKFCFKNVRT